MEIVVNPWHREFKISTIYCGNSLVVVSPYIQLDTVKFIPSVLQGKLSRLSHVRVLTRLDVADFIAGVSSIEALRLLISSGAVVKACSNLHAKIYLFDNRSAIVTSANATGRGIAKENGNLEFGINVTDDEKVEEIACLVGKWFHQALDVTEEMLDGVEVVVNELKAEQREVLRLQQSMRTKISLAQLPKAPAIGYEILSVPKRSPEESKSAALTQVCGDRKFEILPKSKYSCCGKVVHVRYTKYQASGTYWFNINANMLSADYALFVCGSSELYYLLPAKVLRELYEASNPDQTHASQGIRSFNIYSKKQEIKGKKGSLPIGAKKYLKKKLPSTR